MVSPAFVACSCQTGQQGVLTALHKEDSRPGPSHCPTCLGGCTVAHHPGHFNNYQSKCQNHNMQVKQKWLWKETSPCLNQLFLTIFCKDWNRFLWRKTMGAPPASARAGQRGISGRSPEFSVYWGFKCNPCSEIFSSKSRMMKHMKSIQYDFCNPGRSHELRRRGVLSISKSENKRKSKIMQYLSEVAHEGIFGLTARPQLCQERW